MIAKICQLQWLAREIKSEQGSTSTSEHHLHQVLLSGMKGTLHLNKNLLKGSALFKVEFVQTTTLERPVPFKPTKITPKICMEFKAQMDTMVSSSDKEGDMISKEFFQLVLTNGSVPTP